MKKLLMMLVAVSFFPSLVRADNPPPSIDWASQATAALTSHATFAVEYRHGSKNLILSDNVVEFGKLKGDYVLSADLGLNGATLPGETQNGIQFTTGVRLNLHTLVKNFVPLKSEWVFLNHFEYYGRGYYNWTDRIWRGSLNVGYGFGPGTPQ